ncbi:putative RNA-directed DNA polymerase [Rosa chinensis]|uniref:Putative RNA-directed DNA polymerase n=1 Tax=Rosa chinensis TaxID=74649 RepID=A0A2P6SDG4_ROSCH|nr:putative RNA-directed DNA polymerase [Rosa chinensis]
MNVLCWNCQGIGNPWTVSGLKGIVSLNLPSVIFLSKTRCTADEMKGVRERLGWKHAFSVNCSFVKKKKGKGVSRSGGLCLLWNDDTKVSLQSYSNNHIDVVIGEEGDPRCWRFTGVYGFPKAGERSRTWNLLKQLSMHGNLPWVVGGDYNEICERSDKMGGVLRSVRLMNDMKEALVFCELDDIQFVGPRFTWRGIRGGEEVRVRLDRFTCSLPWRDLFPASRVRHLDPSTSDHVPILLEVRIQKKRRKKRKKKRFKFEECWLLDETCKEVVKSSWESVSGVGPTQLLWNRMQSTRAALESWSEKSFGCIRKEIAKIRNQLSVFYDSSLSAPLEEDRVALQLKLNDLLHQEQVFWRQRAKVFWLKDGDLNTKFFHQRVKNRKKKNTLTGLFNNDGVWSTEVEELEDIVLHYFNDLFTSSYPEDFQNILEGVLHGVSEVDNRALTRRIDKEEVFAAIKNMHPSKSPGPDGFSQCFFQTFWELVGDDIVGAVREFFVSKESLRAVNSTYVALIPKVEVPQYMHQLRPISLCNVVYKIGSKVLANRLKPLLDSLISPFQSAFVPGRLISDNSLMAFEVSHCLKRRRSGKVGYCALKLDMSKAYDRVEWVFLEAVMRKMGFGEEWIRWIMDCVSTVSYSFIINGEPRGRVIPSRGLRQGDSISPYLFLLCSEVLSRSILNAERIGSLYGVRICMGAPSISHLFFADDSFIFFRAGRDDCEVVKSLLLAYERASGQQVNYQKSCISFSKNVDILMQEGIATILGVIRVDKHDKYLGLPIELSYSKVEAFGFLNEKIRNRTQGWREKTLSTAGKEVLIKAVAQAIPSYVMSCFEVPRYLCDEMHRVIAQFWWGDEGDARKIHWIAWEKLCYPKCQGGLGFRNMHIFNLALLTKQGWRLIQQPDSIIAKLLKAKYFPRCSFLEAELKGGESYTWRSILLGRKVLEKGMRFQVGDGESIRVWDDPWVPVPYSFRPYSPVMEGLEELRVADLIDPITKDWLVDFMGELFTAGEVEKMACIPLSLRGAHDRLIWHYTKSGLYSVRSGYHAYNALVGGMDRASSSLGEYGGVGSKYWKMI